MKNKDMYLSMAIACLILSVIFGNFAYPEVVQKSKTFQKTCENLEERETLPITSGAYGRTSTDFLTKSQCLERAESKNAFWDTFFLVLPISALFSILVGPAVYYGLMWIALFFLNIISPPKP